MRRTGGATALGSASAGTKKAKIPFPTSSSEAPATGYLPSADTQLVFNSGSELPFLRMKYSHYEYFLF